MTVREQNISQMVDEQRRRLAINRNYFRSVTAGLTTDHAPDCACGGHPQTQGYAYDASALAGIRDQIAAVGRGIDALRAGFERRQAQLTADSAREAIAAQGRAAIDRVRNGPLAAMNARNAAFYGRAPAGQPAPFPPGFTADASGAALTPGQNPTIVAFSARCAAFWGARARP